MAGVHKPGQPGDLPDAGVLWRRWAGAALAMYDHEQEGTAAVHRTGCWIDDAGLHWDDSGCTWWEFKWFGDGRAVLFGEDETSQVKWHEPAIDVLAGAPQWVPRRYLRGLIDAYMVGCVYWFEDGAWHRAPYPDDLRDDGLGSGVGRLTTRAGALETISLWRDSGATDPELCERLLDAAERGAVTEDLVRTCAEGLSLLAEEDEEEEDLFEEDDDPEEESAPDADSVVAAVFALAQRAGLDTVTWTGTLGVRD
ncbi:hypothetical protein ACFVMC_30505 [Nocardia sp. NPDC127579]|uniref:hypothetical protein n=1 Tax=Nocardia sp. NPDC127579 TaxID=3345402 RepID=UPI00362EF4AE